MSSLTAMHAPKGLEGVVATTSKICYIDGELGVLAYGGIDIHELADHSTFEETCYLLWNGKLPNQTELKELRQRLAAERKLDPAIIDFLRSVPKGSAPMDVLRTAVSALGLYDPEEKDNDHAANISKAIRLTSQIAMLVAAYDRLRKGKNVVEPDRSLSHSANSSPIGALQGPLHGGANEAVFLILQKIDAAGADPVAYVRDMLAQKKKISGFGHRVYHTEDPRATHLRKMSEDLGHSSGEPKWFEMSRKIELFVKAEKKLNANVDFYSA